jgi:hypothetical protein
MFPAWCTTASPQAQKQWPNQTRIEISKTVSQYKPFSFKLLNSGICYSDGKLANKATFY